MRAHGRLGRAPDGARARALLGLERRPTAIERLPRGWCRRTSRCGRPRRWCGASAPRRQRQEDRRRSASRRSATSSSASSRGSATGSRLAQNSAQAGTIEIDYASLDSSTACSKAPALLDSRCRPPPTRVPIPLEVEYRTAGAFLVSYSVNLSKGGIFIETNTPLEPGSTSARSFDVPGAGTLEVEGVVAWVRTGSPDGLPDGMGIQFERLDERYGEPSTSWCATSWG